MEKDGAARKRTVNGWMISTIVLGVACVVLGLILMSLVARDIHQANEATFEVVNSDRDTDYIMENDLEVSFEGEFLIDEDESGYVDTGQLVVVKNKSNETLSFNIHVEATNEDGSVRLGEDYLAVEKLAAGQSKTSRVFTFMEKEEAEKLVGAKFRIVEVAEYE